jgi:hypothetical protein
MTVSTDSTHIYPYIGVIADPWDYIIESNKSNNTKANAISFPADSTPPVTIASPLGGIYNSNKTVTLSCSDGTGSGCSKIYYTTNGTSPTTASQVYTAPLSIVSTTTLKYFATDIIGNSEMIRNQTYTIDKIPPVVAVNPVMTPTISNSQTIIATIEAGSTIAVTTGNSASVGAVTYPTTTSWKCTISNMPLGTNTVKMTAKDAAGNTSVVQTVITVVKGYTITQVNSGCGTITPSGPVTLLPGSNQTFSFQASTGAYLAEVLVDGVSKGIVSTYSFTNIDRNYTLTVRFIIPDGDVNNNGIVDTADALLAQRIAVGLETATPIILAHGDVAPLVNNVPAPNGLIDIADALVILRKTSGLITWNTVCGPAQQAIATSSLAATTMSASTVKSPVSSAETSTGCKKFYKKFNDNSLLKILEILNSAKNIGKGSLNYGGYSMVANKIDECTINLELYDNYKQTNLLCTDEITLCGNE